jgi:tRNA nucleotidyltransferase (CCA-adding enzyme)
MPELPEKVVALSRAIHDAGGRALLVGGCVRDELMGTQPKDWDLEVYELEAVRLRELLDRFGSVNAVGESFTVYKLGHDVDVSIPRRERKSGRGHRAFVIEGDPAMDFAAAARRRDFTINAILQDPLTGALIDPFQGRRDIEQRLLRAVSADTFAEDSLRVLRAAQFASRFQFEIDSDTVALCQSIDLSDLPAERIWGELEKLLLLSAVPSIGLEWLRRLGVIEKLFPEIQSLIGVPQDPEWHPEGDVFVHTKLVVDRARELIDELSYSRQVAVMLGALAHDFGKPGTTRMMEGRWRSLGHDEAGLAPAEAFLERLNVHTIDGYNVSGQVIA